MGNNLLDARAEICPYPFVMTKQRMKKLAPGETLVVLVDSPLSFEHISRWAALIGHAVLQSEKIADAEWEIHLRKKV